MTNKLGQPNKDLPDEVVREIRKLSQRMSVKGIYNIYRRFFNIAERTVRRVINYETYKDVK